MDWRNRNLEERIQHLFKLGLASDFTIRHEADGKTKVYNVHKVFLTLASPVFETLFENKNLDKENYETVLINDVDVKILDLFVKFIYLHKLELKSVKEAWSLYYLGGKYLIQSLKEFCLDYINLNSNDESFCTSYEKSKLYGLTDMSTNFKREILKKSNLKRILKSEDFLQLSPESILMLLDETDLNVREIELFLACSWWIKNYFKDKDCDCEKDPENTEAKKDLEVPSSTRPELVRMIFSKIFFYDMTPNELVQVFLSRLLTNEETHSIIMNIVDDRKLLSSSGDSPLPWPEYFPSGKRKVQVNEEETDKGKVGKGGIKPGVKTIKHQVSSLGSAAALVPCEIAISEEDW